MKRLVILGSTETALALARDASRYGVDPVVFDDWNGIAFKSRYVHDKPRVFGSDADRERAMIALGGPETALMATGDHWLRAVKKIRGELETHYGAVMVASDAVLDICLDKTAFTQWCRAESLPAPVSWLVGEEERPADLTLPMILRPRQTLHAAALSIPKAIEVTTEAELEHWLTQYREAKLLPLVSHSLLARDLVQYSIPFARRGTQSMSFVATKVRPIPRACAVGTYMATSPNADVEALAMRAVERLDFQGIGEVEILHDRSSGENFLIEINARPWLQYSLAPATGREFLAFMLDIPMLDGNRPREGAWWNPLADVLQTLKSAGQTPLGVARQAVATALATKAQAKFALDDPFPGLPSTKAVTRRLKKLVG